MDEMLSYITTIAGLFITALTFLLKFAKSAKKQKAIRDTMAIFEATIPFVKAAQNFINYSGIEKKEFVMTKARQYALENSINFDENLVSEKVEEYVSLINIEKNKFSKIMEKGGKDEKEENINEVEFTRKESQNTIDNDDTEKPKWFDRCPAEDFNGFFEELERKGLVERFLQFSEDYQEKIYNLFYKEEENEKE